MNSFNRSRQVFHHRQGIVLATGLLAVGLLLLSGEKAVRADDQRGAGGGRAAGGLPGVIVLDDKAVIGEHARIPREYLLEHSPQPMAGQKIFYESHDKKLRVGIWESEAGSLKLDMTFDEYVRVLEGSTILRSADGRTWTFKAGDSFLLPRGFRGEARQPANFRKQFIDVQ